MSKKARTIRIKDLNLYLNKRKAEVMSELRDSLRDDAPMFVPSPDTFVGQLAEIRDMMDFINKEQPQ